MVAQPLSDGIHILEIKKKWDTPSQSPTKKAVSGKQQQLLTYQPPWLQPKESCHDLFIYLEKEGISIDHNFLLYNGLHSGKKGVFYFFPYFQNMLFILTLIMLSTTWLIFANIVNPDQTAPQGSCLIRICDICLYLHCVVKNNVYPKLFC